MRIDHSAECREVRRADIRWQLPHSLAAYPRCMPAPVPTNPCVKRHSTSPLSRRNHIWVRRPTRGAAAPAIAPLLTHGREARASALTHSQPESSESITWIHSPTFTNIHQPSLDLIEFTEYRCFKREEKFIKPPAAAHASAHMRAGSRYPALRRPVRVRENGTERRHGSTWCQREIEVRAT